MRQSLSLPLPRTAAIFIDLQEEHRRDPGFLAEGFDRVVANCVSLQRAARDNGVSCHHYAFVVDTAANRRAFHPVRADGKSVFSDKDDPNSAICPEVAPLPGERLLIKNRASSFVEDLGPELQQRGVEWLVIAGVWTEACVYETVKDAQALGFRVLLVKDACGSGTTAMHEIAMLNLANRLYGGAVATTEAACRLLAGEATKAWQVQGAVPMRYTYETASALYAEL